MANPNAGPVANGPSVSFPAFVSVTPKSFKVDLKLNEEVFLKMKLENVTGTLVTFKVKTTNRDRYGVRPTQGYIPIGGYRICEIVLARMVAYPPADNPKNFKDKFLVQSLSVSSELSNDDLTKFWKDREREHKPKEDRFAYHEQRIKCKLQIPARIRAEQQRIKGLDEASTPMTAGGGVNILNGPGAPTTTTNPTAVAMTTTGNGSGGSTDTRSDGTSPTVSVNSIGPQNSPIPAATGVATGSSGGTGPTPTTTTTTSTTPAPPIPAPGTQKTTTESRPATTDATHGEITRGGVDDGRGVPAVSDATHMTNGVSSARHESRAGERDDRSLSKQQQYEELTLENEKRRSEFEALMSKYNTLLRQHEQAQKTLQLLASGNGSTAATAATAGNNNSGGSGVPAAVSSSGVGSAGSGNTANEMDTRRRPSDSKSDRRRGGGIALHVWQLSLLALFFFVLGRIFSDML